MSDRSSVKARTQNPSELIAEARALFGASLGFRDCEGPLLDALVAVGHIRHVGKGELLVARGTAFQTLCMVVRGSIEVSLCRADGSRHLVSYIRQGDLIGLMDLVDGGDIEHDLIAHEAGSVLLMPGEPVRRLIDQERSLARAFERQLVFRSRLLYSRLSADPSIPLDVRLAHLLELMSQLHGRPTPEGVVLDMKISQSDLADWLGITRQRVNYNMGLLVDAGLLKLNYSKITVIAPEQLRQHARLV